jgi:hypothetical protein
MNRLKWMLFESARRLDRSAQAGLALLAAAIVFQLAVSAPAQVQLELLRREAARTKGGAEQAERARQRGDSAPDSARTSEFYQYFPPRQDAPEWLERIYQAAGKQALELAQGEYKLAPGKTGKLLEYQISLPVKGSYAQVRRFVVQVLHDVPAASLDELTFKRDAIGSAEVEAKVRLTLHMRSQ